MNLVIFIVIGVLIVLLILLVLVSYVKAPPDVAYIISGLRKEPRIVIGKASFRIPFFERLDKLPLELMQVDVKTQLAVPTAEFINIYVDGVANIKISKNEEALKKAAQNFLNMNSDDIALIAKENLEGNLREIVGQMKLTELVNQRDIFAQKVRDNASDDMGRMGLEVVNFTVQNFRDDYDAINNLGVDNLARIQKDAQIARAQAERDVKIESSKADEEGARARALADANIAEQQKDLVVKKAEFKKIEDKAKAEADAAYSINEQIQQKVINTNEVNAEVEKAERLADLEEKKIAIKERTLDADIKKTADAELYRRQKEAEAELFEKQKEAEAIKAQADADKYAQEKQAEAIKAKLLAEAEGIKAKGLAEAEAIEKKALAQAKMKEASIIEMYMKTLPDVAKAISEPLNNVDNITLYGDNNTTKLIEEGTKNLDQIMNLCKNSLGIDLSELANGVKDRIIKK